MDNAINLGFIQIHYYSITMLLGLIIGSKIILKECKKQNIDEKQVEDIIFYSILFGIIGARLYYVIFEFNQYKNNIIDIFKVWQGGLAIHGGIIAGLLVIIFFTKKYKINLLKLLDITVVGLIIGQAIGRWGNFFNQEAHGPKVDLEVLQNLKLPQFIIDGMNIGNYYYHPTFLYESIWCILGFIVLLLIRKIKYIKLGQCTSFYLVWYGIGRFLIESLRTDSLYLGNIKVAQFISILMITSGILMFVFQIFKGKDNKNE